MAFPLSELAEGDERTACEEKRAKQSELGREATA